MTYEIVPLGQRLSKEIDRCIRIRCRVRPGFMGGGYGFYRCGIEWTPEWQIVLVSESEHRALSNEVNVLEVDGSAENFDVEAALADPEAVCAFVKSTLFEEPRSAFADLLEAELRGCMKAAFRNGHYLPEANHEPT